MSRWWWCRRCRMSRDVGSRGAGSPCAAGDSAGCWRSGGSSGVVLRCALRTKCGCLHAAGPRSGGCRRAAGVLVVAVGQEVVDACVCWTSGCGCRGRSRRRRVAGGEGSKGAWGARRGRGRAAWMAGGGARGVGRSGRTGAGEGGRGRRSVGPVAGQRSEERVEAWQHSPCALHLLRRQQRDRGACAERPAAGAGVLARSWLRSAGARVDD